ncbi:hypothetical protein LTR85_010206 [Meristemomyces frigidus]|nr:hypothetical protein LTR85_010206 [Meristemomyces frigidus]
MPLANKSFGEGTPVLFVHGWELDSAYDIAEFEPIFSKLTGYRRIYFDLPGMGKTPADEAIVDMESIYARVVAFIEEHISPASFILIGTSLGGYLARALATQFEPQILGLHLKVPVIEPDDRRRDLDVFKPVVQNEASMGLIPNGQLRSIGNVLVQTPAYISMLVAKMTSIVVPSEASANSAVLDPIRADPRRYSLDLIESRREASFNKPTLIITGRHDDVVGYRDSLRLLELYPRATFVALDRGIHLLPIDEGHLVQALVLDWLRRVEESSNRAVTMS